jgi:probable blue pigment (indigoidine) exporter
VSTFIEVGSRRAAVLRGLFFLGVTACMWGLNWPVNKYVLSELPPFTARACTGVVGTLFFLALALARRERLAVPREQWRPLLVSTLLNFSGFIAFSSLSLLWLHASEAVIITYTMPIWATILAIPVLGERPGVRGFVGLALGFGGVLILVLAQPVEASWASLPGALCCLTAALVFGLGTVLAKRNPVRLPGLTSIFWQIGLGSIPLALAGLLFDHPHFARVDHLAWLGLLYTGALGLGLGYLTWFRALALLPASTTATGSLMVPVIGVLGSGLMLGEPLGLRQFAALGMTLGGVALAVRR